MTLVGGVV